MKRRWKILLGLVVGCVLVFVIFMPHGGYRRSLEAYKQELRAKGEKLTVAELAPPRSTSISAAAKFFSGATNIPSANFNLPSRMHMVAPGRAQVTFTNITSDLLQDYVQNTNAMAEIRKVLAVPVLDFDLDYSKAYAALVPHAPIMKQAAQLATATAMQALQRKDYDEAWADLLAAADLVRLWKNDSMMISDLVRIADAAIAYTANWEALEGARWTDAQLAQLQAKWEDMDLFQLSIRSLEMDRAINIEMFADARKDEPASNPFAISQTTAASVAPSDADSGSERGLVQRLKALYDRYPRVWMWKSSWSYDEELFELQSISAAAETARRIIDTSAAAPALAELRVRQTNIVRLHGDGLSHFYLSSEPDNYISYLEKLASAEAVRRVQVTAFALKRYQLRHGAYPPTLAELVPEFLRQVPIDFMDGKPLRYRLKPDGDYLLYSVGADGVDDGGDGSPNPAGNSGSLYWIRARDIVWPRPSTMQEAQAYEKSHPTPTNSPSK